MCEARCVGFESGLSGLLVFVSEQCTVLCEPPQAETRHVCVTRAAFAVCFMLAVCSARWDLLICYQEPTQNVQCRLFRQEPKRWIADEHAVCADSVQCKVGFADNPVKSQHKEHSDCK
jgi:hypothetical protein